MTTIRFIDSHTGGEPTRVILTDTSFLGTGPLSERKRTLTRDFDGLRRATVCEPRGFGPLVGALLCAPSHAECVAGVIFFNSAGYLGMCGHAMMGVAVTLHRLGRIGLGHHCIETPVGIVDIQLVSSCEVTVINVDNYRYRHDVSLCTRTLGRVRGDIAWGGNWFFVAEHRSHSITPANVPALCSLCNEIARALVQQHVHAEDGVEIDHILLYERINDGNVDARCFVLCPNGSYDRAPCGTGTSALLACRAADKELEATVRWVQESVTGAQFHARYRWRNPRCVIPTISGQSFICGEGEFVRHRHDPLIHDPVSSPIR